MAIGSFCPREEMVTVGRRIRWIESFISCFLIAAADGFLLPSSGMCIFEFKWCCKTGTFTHSRYVNFISFDMAVSHEYRQHFQPLRSNTPGDEMIAGLAALIPNEKEEVETKTSPTIQIRSEDDWRRLRRNIITRRR